MVRKSNYSKTALLAAVGRAVMAFQDATDEVDDAVARQLELNRTDLRCLSVLSRSGPVTPSALADASGLTRGAMTTALDRLEQAGLVQRVWDQVDRRSARVEMTGQANRAVGRLYAPLAEEGAALLQQYTAAELAAVLRYLEDGERLQRAHARKLRESATR
jgi:DNA-binding MarR family transcriptional regulator